MSDLGAVLAQLLGEPSLSARTGYGDELTLHFGTACAADHPRMRERGSACDTQSQLILEGVDAGQAAGIGKHVAVDVKNPIYSGEFIRVVSPVAAVAPYEIEQPGGIGLRLETVDLSGIIIIHGDRDRSGRQ